MPKLRVDAPPSVCSFLEKSRIEHPNVRAICLAHTEVICAVSINVRHEENPATGSIKYRILDMGARMREQNRLRVSRVDDVEFIVVRCWSAYPVGNEDNLI